MARYTRENDKFSHDIIAELFEHIDVKGMSFRSIASQTGVSTNTMRDWRKGKAPRLDLLVAVAQVVGFTIELKSID